jgi:hypothetical protein
MPAEDVLALQSTTWFQLALAALVLLTVAWIMARQRRRAVAAAEAVGSVRLPSAPFTKRMWYTVASLTFMAAIFASVAIPNATQTRCHPDPNGGPTCETTMEPRTSLRILVFAGGTVAAATLILLVERKRADQSA